MPPLSTMSPEEDCNDIISPSSVVEKRKLRASTTTIKFKEALPFRRRNKAPSSPATRIRRNCNSAPSLPKRKLSLENLFNFKGTCRGSSENLNASWSNSSDGKKGVRFNDQNNKTMKIDCLSNSELALSWYSRAELLDMRQAARKIIAKANFLKEAAEHYDPDYFSDSEDEKNEQEEQEDVTGLEKFLDDVRDMRKDRQVHAMDTVLDLQYLLSTNRKQFLYVCEDIMDIFDASPQHDADRIAFYYRRSSESSAETAFDSGLLLSLELKMQDSKDQ